MVALIVIAVIIAIFAVIIIVPIKCRIYFLYDTNDMDADTKLYYGPFKIKLPSKEKSEEEQNPSDDEEQAENNEKKRKVRRMVSFAVKNTGKIKKIISELLYYLLKKKIKINSLSVKLISGTDDAMETALIYGAVSAFVYNAAGLMDRNMKLEKCEIDLKPNFDNPHIFTELEAIISTNILKLAGLVIRAIYRAIPLLRSYRKTNSKGEKQDG